MSQSVSLFNKVFTHSQTPNQEELEERELFGNNMLKSMSHPETMLNVLRYCVKLLRQQQSKEFALRVILLSMSQAAHTPCLQWDRETAIAVYHKQSYCKAAELPLVFEKPCHFSNSATTSYTASSSKH